MARLRSGACACSMRRAAPGHRRRRGGLYPGHCDGDRDDEWQRAFEASASARRRLHDDVGRARSSRCTGPTTASSPASTRTRAARTRRCTARSSGRCGCSPASAPRSTPTAGSTSCSRAGGDGLSTAFDLPTLHGPRLRRPARARRGRASAASRSTRSPTWRTSTAASTSATVTTSMTINAPAAILLAMYVAAAERTGVARAATRRHAPERHPEGVPGAEGVHLPAAPVDAARRRHDPVLRGGDAALAPDLDLRLPHPRGGLDRRAGARVHARQRVRVRRGGGRRPGSTVDDVRAAPVVLLQRAHRLLRGDRQVPRRPAHLGALDARALRRAAASARCSCGSTPRPRACRSPRSSPRSTSCAPRSRRSPACSAARRACTRTRWTRCSRCPPRRRPASRCAPSR